MPVTANTPNFDNSIWYTKMQNRANLWNKYALENGFEIDGNYDAYGVKFEIIGKIYNNPIIIKGRRLLVTVPSFVLPINGKFFEKLTINLNSSKIQSKYYIHVTKKGFFSFLKKKLDHNVSIGKYTVSHNSNIIIDFLKKSEVLVSNNLVKFSIDNKGIKLKLYELPKSKEKLNLLKILWEQNYG